LGIRTSRNKEAESITWNLRDFEQRMLKERETLEEERQAIAARREEYLREVKEWEERLDTVSARSTDSMSKKKFGFGTIGRIKFGGKT